MFKDVNEMIFPGVIEGDRILWEDGNWYIYTSNKWILENK
jgi:hypothetical protein